MELLFTEIGKVRGEAGLWGDGEELHPGLRNFSLMGLSCDLEGLSGRSRVGMCGVLDDGCLTTLKKHLHSHSSSQGSLILYILVLSTPRNWHLE